MFVKYTLWQKYILMCNWRLQLYVTGETTYETWLISCAPDCVYCCNSLKEENEQDGLHIVVYVAVAIWRSHCAVSLKWHCSWNSAHVLCNVKMTFIFLVFHPPGKVPKEEDSGWSPEPVWRWKQRRNFILLWRMKSQLPTPYSFTCNWAFPDCSVRVKHHKSFSNIFHLQTLAENLDI